MAERNNLEAFTDDGRAPVLSEDRAETPIEGKAEQPRAMDRPMEENDYNAQTG